MNSPFQTWISQLATFEKIGGGHKHLPTASSAGVELRGITYAEGSVAAEILLALAENNCQVRSGRRGGSPLVHRGGPTKNIISKLTIFFIGR